MLFADQRRSQRNDRPVAVAIFFDADAVIPPIVALTGQQQKAQLPLRILKSNRRHAQAAHPILNARGALADIESRHIGDDHGLVRADILNVIQLGRVGNFPGQKPVAVVGRRRQQDVILRGPGVQLQLHREAGVI